MTTKPEHLELDTKILVVLAEWENGLSAKDLARKIGENRELVGRRLEALFRAKKVAKGAKVGRHAPRWFTSDRDAHKRWAAAAKRAKALKAKAIATAQYLGLLEPEDSADEEENEEIAYRNAQRCGFGKVVLTYEEFLSLARQAGIDIEP